MRGPGVMEPIVLAMASMRAKQDDLSELTALSQSVRQALLQVEWRLECPS